MPQQRFLRAKPTRILLKKWWIFWVLGIGAIIITTAHLVTNYFNNQPLASPINQLSRFEFINHTTPTDHTPKIVYGFLPYWNLNRVKLNNQLTNLAYFRLAINDDGSVQVKNDNSPESGYQKLQSEQFLQLIHQLESQQTKLEIVLTIFDDETATRFFESTEAQTTLLQNLDSIILAYPITGLNLDFEVTASTGVKLKPKLTQFVTQLHQHLNQRATPVSLSIDVYPSAASGAHIWNLTEIAPMVDHVVLMAYDFHRRNSTQAGPVAPLFGGGDIFANDIHGYLRDTIKQVPPQKILLGVPFYGYAWQTVDQTSQSHTYPDSGRTVFYSQITQLINQPGVTRHWNAKALTPYLTYEQAGKKYLVYYDDKHSLHYKLELVNQLDLGGVAIWALGYEGETQELWQEIDHSFNQS